MVAARKAQEADVSVKKASLRPVDFTSAPLPLNLEDKKAVDAIHKMSLPDFISGYAAPPKDTDGYLDMRRLPVMWSYLVKDVPENHLFLHTTCRVSADKRLVELVRIRESAEKLCQSTNLGEAGLLWLSSRPRFSLGMVVANDRRKFPCWNATVRNWLGDTARALAISSRVLFIVYSSKTLLETTSDMGNLRGKIEEEVQNWDAWLEREITEISRFSSLV